MILSPAERAFLYDSLSQQPPIRPDARSEHQFRPVEAKTGFLPASNGLARMRLLDGSECIVSVKLKVVLQSREPNLVECDVDVAGFRDDSNYIANLRYSLTSLLLQSLPAEGLRLTSKYAFKLFVDCIVVSHSLYPLTLMSLTAYLALKTTHLPLLVSEIDDAEIEEQPTFADDWESAQLLATLFKNDRFQPPIVVTLGVVGENLVFDPSLEEEQVLENGLLVSWYDGRVITPVANINLAKNSNNSNHKGLNARLVAKSIAMASQHCGAIVEALDALVEMDVENDGTVF